MNSIPATNTSESKKVSWRQVVARYENPDLCRSLWQVVNSITPYLVLWCLMYRSLQQSYWLTLGLSVLAMGFFLRIFIIFHDCGHCSFFKSHKANGILGFLTGVLTFTPYHRWRHDHAIHHATSGDLDRRGIGDLRILTVREYLESTPWKRLVYRVYRNPLVMFVIAPPLIFLIWNRFSVGAAGKRERHNVYLTNFALLALITIMSQLIGFKQYITLQLPILIGAGTVGVWLFFVQHHFEKTYWEDHENWNYLPAAMQGSSFYKLPKILQWFTGNIGFHHVHHLSPRIPNYYLQKCHEENPIMQKIEPLTLFASFRSLTLRLWHEEERKMVGFRYLKTFKTNTH